MIEFPIEKIYRRVAKIDVLRNDSNSVIGGGSGFFYRYDDRIFFATNRNYIIVEERAFLPDSLVLYPNIETQALGNSGIALQLYDKKEKPTWQLLPTKTSEQFVSIPVSDDISQLDFVQYFLSPLELPAKVLLPIGEFTLTIPIQTCVSLANYFFYSYSSDEKTIKDKIEQVKVFKIDRKGFARDMIEMILLLMERNLFLMKNFEPKAQDEEELSNYNHVHQNLVKELEKIISQFQDVLEPSIFERVQNIFNIVKNKNFMEDYLIVHHLINRVLSQLGNNIYYMQ